MSVTEILVNRITADEPMVFDVTLREGAGETRHIVSLSHAQCGRLCEGAPEKLVRAAVQFLLDREAKEEIMERFDVSVISRYFPEFEQKVGSYLDAE